MDWPQAEQSYYYRKTSAKDVTNTVTKTDLLNGEITIPGKKLGLNGVLKAILVGDYLNNAATEAPADVFVEFGGTTLWHSAAANMSQLNSNSARRPFRMEFSIHNLAATNSQYMAGSIWLGSPGGTTGLGGGLDIAGAVLGDDGAFSTSGATAVDTTADCLLAVPVQWASATTTRSWRLQAAFVEVIPG